MKFDVLIPSDVSYGQILDRAEFPNSFETTAFRNLKKSGLHNYFSKKLYNRFEFLPAVPKRCSRMMFLVKVHVNY